MYVIIILIQKGLGEIMKRINGFVIFVMLWSIISVKAEIAIKAGSNMTQIQNYTTGWKHGIVLGIEKSFVKIGVLKMTGGLEYITKMTKIKNLPVYFDNEKAVNAYNLDTKLTYLETPLYAKIQIPYTHFQNLNIFGGISFSLPLTENTEFKKQKFLYSWDPYTNPERNFKYSITGSWETIFFDSFNYGYFAGLNFSFSKFLLEIRYRRDHNGIGAITPIYPRMDKRFKSWYFLIGFLF